MNPRDDDPLHAAINAKLAAIVETSPTPPDWYDAWIHLSPESTEEERLAVYQAVRDSGCLSDDLVSWQIDALASLDAEISLCHLDEQMKAIEQAHGLAEGEFWPPGKAPPQYKELRRNYETAWDGIFAEMLAAFGEHDMAQQFRANPDEFQRRSKAGQESFYGRPQPDESDAPEWLYALVETVAGSMTGNSDSGPLGFLYGEEEGVWEIVIYPKPVELVALAAELQADVVAVPDHLYRRPLIKLTTAPPYDRLRCTTFGKTPRCYAF